VIQASRCKAPRKSSVVSQDDPHRLQRRGVPRGGADEDNCRSEGTGGQRNGQQKVQLFDGERKHALSSNEVNEGPVSNFAGNRDVKREELCVLTKDQVVVA